MGGYIAGAPAKVMPRLAFGGVDSFLNRALMVLNCAVSALTLATIYHTGSVKERYVPEEAVRRLDDRGGLSVVRGSRGGTRGVRRHHPPLLPLSSVPSPITSSTPQFIDPSIQKLATEPRVMHTCIPGSEVRTRSPGSSRGSNLSLLFFLFYRISTAPEVSWIRGEITGFFMADRPQLPFPRL